MKEYGICDRCGSLMEKKWYQGIGNNLDRYTFNLDDTFMLSKHKAKKFSFNVCEMCAEDIYKILDECGLLEEFNKNEN